MKYDKVIIRCFRTTDPRVLMVDGAQKVKCERCGHLVWVAPSSLRMKKEMQAIILCDGCEKVCREPDEVREILPQTTEQLAEVKDGLYNQKRRN